MSGPTHDRPALDHDQAAVLHRLRAVFGAEQVTVTAVQATRQPDPDPAQPPVWQATLSEEAACTSTCS